MIVWHLDGYGENDRRAITIPLPRAVDQDVCQFAEINYTEPLDDHNCGEFPIFECEAHYLMQTLGYPTFPQNHYWYLSPSEE